MMSGQGADLHQNWSSYPYKDISMICPEKISLTILMKRKQTSG